MIAAIATVGAGLKSSSMEGGVNLDGRPRRTEVAYVEKCFKSGGDNGNPENKMALPAINAMVQVQVKGLGR